MFILLLRQQNSPSPTSGFEHFDTVNPPRWLEQWESSDPKQKWLSVTSKTEKAQKEKAHLAEFSKRFYWWQYIDCTQLYCWSVGETWWKRVSRAGCAVSVPSISRVSRTYWEARICLRERHLRNFRRLAITIAETAQSLLNTKEF